MSDDDGNIGFNKTMDLLSICSENSSPESCKCWNSEIEGVITLNPLLVELILVKVLDCLRINDLKSARLVCKYWNEVTIPLLQRKAPEISFNEDNYWTNAKNHRIDAMKQFTDVVETSPNFPFIKLDVGSSVVSFLHETTVNNFFRICSPMVEQLTIRDEWGKKIFHSGYPTKMNFDRLQSLSIHLLNTTSNIQHFFGFIQEIIRLAPYLKTLILINHNGTDEGEVVTHMLSVMKRNPLNCLKHLVMEAQMNNPDLITLSKLNLCLTSLTFDFWGSSFTSEAMTMFLTSQRKTLECLKICDSAMSTDCQIRFPRMEQLKTLKIKGSMLGRLTVTFPNISFVEQFPKLHLLSLHELFGEWEDFLSVSMKPTTTVKELKLPSDFADDVSLRRAAYIFPNLKKLELPPYPQLLEVVYNCMCELEELIINTRYVGNIDHVITGIPAHLCKRIMEFNCDNPEERKSSYIKAIKPNKSITNLQKLKKLRLKCKRASDIVEITDVSWYYALLHMNALKYLDLDGRPNQLSNSCLAKMSEKLLVLL